MTLSLLATPQDLLAAAEAPAALGVTELLLLHPPELLWSAATTPAQIAGAAQSAQAAAGGIQVTHAFWCFLDRPGGGEIAPWTATEGEWSAVLRNAAEWAKHGRMAWDGEPYDDETGVPGDLLRDVAWSKPALMTRRGKEFRGALGKAGWSVYVTLESVVKPPWVPGPSAGGPPVPTHGFAQFWRGNIGRVFLEDTYDYDAAHLKARLPKFRGYVRRELGAQTVPGLSWRRGANPQLAAQWRACGGSAWLYDWGGALRDPAACGALRKAAHP